MSGARSRRYYKRNQNPSLSEINKMAEEQAMASKAFALSKLPAKRPLKDVIEELYHHPDFIGLIIPVTPEGTSPTIHVSRFKELDHVKILLRHHLHQMESNNGWLLPGK